MISGYKLIPFSRDLYINEEGVVIDKDNNVQNTWVNQKNSRLTVNVTLDTGDRRSMSIVYLLAKCFVLMPKGLTDKTARVFQKDGNKENISINNLEWVPKHYEKKLNYAKYLKDIRIKHKSDLVSYENAAVECIAKPGYYYVPESDHPLVISKNGLVFDLEKNKYINTPICSGYKIFNIRKNGFNTSVKVHRVLAMLFILIPKRLDNIDICALQINHIDGDKLNNSLDNLEWVTSQENIQHAYSNFLSDKTTVLSKHILSGKVILYPTMVECSRQYGLGIKRFTRHLKSIKAGTITKNWHVFKFDDGTPWPELNKKQYGKNRWDINFGIWYAKSIESEKILINNTLEGLCSAIPLNYAYVQSFITKYKNRPFQGWTIWYDDEPLEEVAKNLPNRVKHVLKPPTALIFTDKATGIVLEFDSIIKAAKHFGTCVNNILYALNKRYGDFKEYIVKRKLEAVEHMPKP